MGNFRVVDAAMADAMRDWKREFALDVLVGLSERPRRLNSKYFYDDKGSKLFSQIMNLDEYYPTDCEREILTNHSRSIFATIGDEPINLVDLGAGDGAKTKIALKQGLDMGMDIQYVPIDISEGAIKELSASMDAEFPNLTTEGLVCEYLDGLNWLTENRGERCNVLMFLGSNIGNFDRPRSRAFLRRLWTALRDGDYALIGFDLKKDIEVLLSAYNDSNGVTAEFNINLLERINRELGGDFKTDNFRHYGTYDVFSGAMVSYLVSLEEQVVEIADLGRSFKFQPWEPIHTEYSYKYLERDIVELAADTGFHIDSQYRDKRGYFVDSLWRVVKKKLAE